MKTIHQYIIERDVAGARLCLRATEKKGSTQLSELLHSADESGLSPLHVAVMTGHFDMVKLLLSYDAPVSLMANGKSALDLSSELAKDNPEEKNFQMVAALIHSRGSWQSEAAKMHGISFSRCIKAIEDAIGKADARGKSGALFLGITGEGKSTLLNYLMGASYAMKRVGRRKQLVLNSGEEVARVGQSTISETLYPQVLNPEGDHPFALVDLPGFEDTRSSAEEICAAASICMLTKQLESIQSLVLVCSWGHLESARMLEFRKSAESIGAMISQNPESANAVIFAVTKPTGDLEIDDVMIRLEQLAVDEGLARRNPDESVTMLPPNRDIKRQNVSPDLWRRHCLSLTLHAILSREDTVLLAEIKDSSARAAFLEKFHAMQPGAQPTRHFDFTNYSRFMRQFQLVVEEILTQYNAIRGQLSVVDKKFMAQTGELKKINARIKEIDAEIEKATANMDKPFSAEEVDAEVAKLRARKKALGKKLRSQESEMRESSSLRAELKAKVEGFNLEEERLIQTVHRGFVCEKIPERIDKKFKELGKVRLADGSWGMRVELEEERIAGSEKTVEEGVNYQSSIPIIRFLDRSHGGTFEPVGFSAGQKSLEGIFKSLPGIHGGVSLSVDVYGKLGDFPDVRDRINRLREELQVIEDKIKAHRQGDVADPSELDDLEEQITNLVQKKALAIGDHHFKKRFSEENIQRLRRLKEDLSGKKEKLEESIKSTKKDAEKFKLAIEVNADLFDKIKEIVTLLELRSEVITQFLTAQSESAPVAPVVPPRRSSARPGLFSDRRHGGPMASGGESLNPHRRGYGPDGVDEGYESGGGAHGDEDYEPGGGGDGGAGCYEAGGGAHGDRSRGGGEGGGGQVKDDGDRKSESALSP